MTPEEFRQAYFEQYSEDGDTCNDAWFQQYFDSSTDWLEVEYRGRDESYVVYSDPESDVGGYWATTSVGEIEGPFQTMGEVAVALGFSPRNFPPDADSDEEDDFDDLDDDLDADAPVAEEEPEFEDDEDFGDFDDEDGDDFDEDED
ncbi:MAG TPA: hypothetical protein PLA50_00185 [Bacteroidia bacterium]|nr:hypothetical protein [Bacteroidia bacterium]